MIEDLKAQPTRVNVTILLKGGYRSVIELDSNHPVIDALYEVLADFAGKRERRLFQLPVNNGKSMLTFPCDSLIAIMTDPPILVEATADATAKTVQLPASRVVQPGVEASRIAIFDDFLSIETQARLMAYTLANEQRFIATSTATAESNYRESAALYDFPEFADLMRRAIRKILSEVHGQLNCKPLSQTIEAQLTSHNDKNFYKIHNDNGSPDSAQRELTYVYYFHGHPKAFSGGELKVYDSRVENGYYVAADSSQLIEPRDNRIVFFLSRYMHEVLPISCPTRKFADSRFTINGWVHRA